MDLEEFRECSGVIGGQIHPGPSGRATVHGAPLLTPAITKHCGCVSPLKPAKVPHLSLKCVMQTHYTAVRWCAESRVTGAQTEMVITCLQPAAKKGLWTLDLRGIRLHHWYQVILRLTLDNNLKGVILRPWSLAHAYLSLKPYY